MKASWKGTVVAESDKTIEIEGNQYFPPESIHPEFFRDNPKHSHCPWKGEASYKDIVVNGETNAGGAWFYPEPKEAAKEIAGYFAFWQGVEVTG